MKYFDVSITTCLSSGVVSQELCLPRRERRWGSNECAFDKLHGSWLAYRRRTYYKLLLRHANACGVGPALNIPEGLLPDSSLQYCHPSPSFYGEEMGFRGEQHFPRKRNLLASHALSHQADTSPTGSYRCSESRECVFGCPRHSIGTVPVIVTCHFNDDPTDESLESAGIQESRRQVAEEMVCIYFPALS